VQKYQYAKYPTRGKIIDFFMKGLEIEYTNDADRKRYQRFVKEENITIDEYNEVFEYCIEAILDEIVSDEKIISQIKQRVNAFFESYIKEVQTVECYNTTQKYLNNYLLAEFFIPFSINFSPKISRLLHFKKEKISMLQFFFQVIQTRKQLNIYLFKNFLFNELDRLTNKEKTDKTLIQDIENWTKGSNYPDNSHILLLAKIFSKILTLDKKTIKQMLMIDKIIYNLDSKIVDEIFSIQTNSYSKNEPNLIPQEIALKMYELYKITDIDKEKSIDIEYYFYKISSELEKKGYSINIPYIALSHARFQAQRKNFKEATKLYLKALKNGKNSLGIYYQLVIKEGLVVSAQITRKNILTLDNAKSPFVKFYKEAYFLKVIDSIPSEINQFFLNDMKKKFSLIFKNLYPNVSSTKGEFKAHEHGLVNLDDLKKIKLDLKRPNKQIKNKYPNPMTQLMHFSLLLKFEEVNKLLKAGANPSEMRFNDNGTALTMILSNEYLDEKKIKAIRISKLLISKMSEEALNAKLPKKRMTALSMSIELGYVDIVKLLLDKGADINQVIDMNDFSPLYYTLLMINNSKGDNLKRSMMNYVPPTDYEILKRIYNFNETLPTSSFKDSITDEEKSNKYQQMRNSQSINPLSNLIKEGLLDRVAKKYQRNKNNYYEIFDLILDYNPDLEIKNIETGHTVLIYATELNEVEIVKKLLERGADKNAVTLQGNNSFDYAKRNNFLELMELLK
jgi:ankyrin repeat protein